MTTDAAAPPDATAPAAPAGAPAAVVAAVLVTMRAWASAFVAIRGVRASFAPGALALGRLAVGSLAVPADRTDMAIGVMAQKPALRRLPALQVTFMACTIGMLGCLPFAGQLVHDGDGATAGAVAGVVYLGLVPTAVAFGTWAFALSRMDAGRLGVTTYLVSPLTIVIAWPVLGEAPATLALAGGLLALGGVALTRRRS